MNKRFVGVLAFATVVATIASLLLYRLLIKRQPTIEAAAVTSQIVLAAHDLEIGTVLKDEDIKLSDWPGTVPPGSTTKVQDLTGRGVTNTIYAKEPVIETRLAPKGAGGGLAAMIPKGMRASAIRVNEVVGVAGFVVAGMHVDVLISGNKPGPDTGSGTLAKTLLQNLEVLSAGQDFKKDAEGKPIMVQVVNLLVTPEQAEQLSLAASQTNIQLVLRNPLDREVAKTPGAAMANLFGGTRLKAEPAPSAPSGSPAPRPRPVNPDRIAKADPPKKEAPFVMEIISGTKKNEMKFDRPVEGK